MRYRYEPSARFWKSFAKLTAEQKDRTRAIWTIFKEDPFDPRLGTHKIQHLSAVSKQTVYAVRIEANLRVIFVIHGDLVTSLDIGTHDLYRS
jgi:Txe/YoeB family toxin of Txe-Axe toxin-antitoxin module